MLPETPAWLVSRGRTDEAKEALLWLRGPGLNTDKEYQDLCQTSGKRKEEKASLLRGLHMPNVWKPFLILLTFFALQQLSGIYVILFYAVSVLKDIGIDVNEYAASVGMGVIRLFASILGAGLANHFGRKTLAFVSGFGMAIAAMGIAVAFRYVSFFNARSFRSLPPPLYDCTIWLFTGNTVCLKSLFIRSFCLLISFRPE